MATPWWRRRAALVALAFAIVGISAAAGAVEYPASRTLLFVLASIFVFAAILTGVLGAERRLRGATVERIYADTAANLDALVEAHELRGPTVYLPNRAGDDPRAWAFVPADADFELPEPGTLRPLFVGPDGEPPRGISLRPSGDGLFREIESVLGGAVSDDPGELAMELADGLTDGVELASSVEPTVDPGTGRVAFRVADAAYGPLDQLDHPIGSLFGTGFAVGLDRPVLTETTIDEGRYDYVVTCYWPRETGEATATETDAGADTNTAGDPGRRDHDRDGFTWTDPAVTSVPGASSDASGRSNGSASSNEVSRVDDSDATDE